MMQKTLSKNLNAKLFIINCGGYNDASALKSKATFKAALQALVTRILALPSRPSVLLVVDPEPAYSLYGSSFVAATHQALLLQYREATYEVCNSNAHCALIDMSVLINNDPALAVDAGLISPHDGVHHTLQGHLYQAAVVGSALGITGKAFAS